MKRLKTPQIALLIVITLLVLSACRTTEIIQVRITPTPDPDIPTSTPTNTETTVTATTITEAQASQPATTTPTHTPVEPTEAEVLQTPLAIVTPLNFIGPAVGADYASPTPAPADDTPLEIPTTTNTPLPPTARPTDTPQPTVTFTPGPSPTPLPELDASQMGLQLYTNVEFDEWMRVIGQTEVTGVGWVKVQVNWAFLQPEGAATFPPLFQLFEQQLEAVKRAGFNVMLSVAKAPDWARSTTQEDGPPDDPQALADFIDFLLNETKIGEVTDAIEIWNEPNLIREWRGILPFDGGGYMQLFAPSYDVIRAYSSEITIITAGLAPTGTIDGLTVDDRVFLQQMYDNGLGNYADVVIGAHPYGWGNPPDARCCPADGRGWDDSPYFFFLDNLEAIYDVMARNGHATNQIWVTEFGWSTWEGLDSEPPELWITFNNAQDQANYTIRAFEIAEELPYVGVMILWNLNFANDLTVDRSNEIVGYSLIQPSLFPSERPLYWAVATATWRDNND